MQISSHSRTRDLANSLHPQRTVFENFGNRTSAGTRSTCGWNDMIPFSSSQFLQGATGDEEKSERKYIPKQFWT